LRLGEYSPEIYVKVLATCVGGWWDIGETSGPKHTKNYYALSLIYMLQSFHYKTALSAELVSASPTLPASLQRPTAKTPHSDIQQLQIHNTYIA